jgi:hypothetical protein
MPAFDDETDSWRNATDVALTATESTPSLLGRVIADYQPRAGDIRELSTTAA